jgi:F-type H+-transporting ATPase subunit gamma
MKRYLSYKIEADAFRDVEETIKVIEKAAASYIHFLTKRVYILKSYKEKLEKILSRLSAFYWDKNHPLLIKREKGIKGLLVITGDKGIVGELYHNVVNEVLTKRTYYDHIWVVGSKGKDYLQEEGIKVEPLFYKFSDLPEIEKIREMSIFFLNTFKNKKFQKIDLLYPAFHSLVEQRPAFVQFLPFEFFKNKALNRDTRMEGFPIFEPSKKTIFNTLIKKYINVFFGQFILEAKLSEFSARTLTAEDAIGKVEYLIHQLHLTFLKERRKALTQKQLESFTVHQII